MKNRSRRLRKKLYVGEFATYGFQIQCDFDYLNHGDNDHFFDAFVDFVESKNLMFGGGFSETVFDAYIVSMGRYDSATNENISEVIDWLEGNPKCSNVRASGLIDNFVAENHF